jgi:hypothetical protein
MWPGPVSISRDEDLEEVRAVQDEGVSEEIYSAPIPTSR